MSEGPTRLTVRGGRDQFDWNNVKDDKHYHNYLGHSLKAPVGRWQRHKDLEWFNKAGTSEEDQKIARLAEIRKIKEAEEEAVAAAMGITLPPREERMGALEGQAAVAKDVDESNFEMKKVRSKRPSRSHSRSRSRSRTRHRSHRQEEHRGSDNRHSYRRRSRERSRDRSRERSDRPRRKDRSRSRDRSSRNHRARSKDRRHGREY